MAIPIATTTVSVLRLSTADDYAEPYNEPSVNRLVASKGIRAHIGAPSGAETIAGGEMETVAFRFDSDPADITHLDWLLDERSGETYRVTWVRLRKGLGLDHMEGGLVQLAGLAG